LLSSKLMGEKFKMNLYEYSLLGKTYAADNWNFDGKEYELFNYLRKKVLVEDFWSRSRKRWMED
jgi:hypothetical protein